MPQLESLFATTKDPHDATEILSAATVGLRPLGGAHGNPVFLPGEPHGQGSLVGYSLWSRKESDTTEQLTYLFIHLFILQTFIAHKA